MLRVTSNVTAPTAITIVFATPVLGVDLSRVTAAHLDVLRRDGTTAVWDLTIVSATPAELIAQYTFTGGAEITSTGTYTLAPVLTVPGGSVSAEAVTLFVGPPGTLTPLLETTTWTVAEVAVDSLGPTKAEWVDVGVAESPYQALATSPWVAVNLTGGSITALLWSGTDGDSVVLSDYLHEAGNGGSLTLIAAAGQTVPVGDGTFANSATYTSPGFVATLKMFSGKWIPWGGSFSRGTTIFEVANHYIDESNSTGLASDTNDGYTAITPLATVAEWERRACDPVFRPIVDTTIWLMSSTLTTRFTRHIQADRGVTITVRGIPTPGATGTLSAVVAIDLPSNTCPSLTGTGLGAVASAQANVKLTSGASSGSAFWLFAAVSGDNVHNSFPSKPNATWGIIGNVASDGDTFEVQTLPSIDVGNWTLTCDEGAPGIAGGGIIILKDINFYGSRTPSALFGQIATEGVTHIYAENCSFNNLSIGCLLYAVGCKFDLACPFGPAAGIEAYAAAIVGNGIYATNGPVIFLHTNPIIYGAFVICSRYVTLNWRGGMLVNTFFGFSVEGGSVARFDGHAISGAGNTGSIIGLGAGCVALGAGVGCTVVTSGSPLTIEGLASGKVINPADGTEGSFGPIDFTSLASGTRAAENRGYGAGFYPSPTGP